MAERVISTRLSITGESEYRQAVKRVADEIKVLTTNLSAVTEKYKNNADSTEALRAKASALADVYEKQKEKVKTISSALDNARASVEKYKNIQEQLRAALEKNNAELANLDMSAEGAAEEHARLTEKAAQLNSELQKNDAYLKSAEDGVRLWEQRLNRANKELYATENQLSETTAKLDDNEQKTRKASEAYDALAQALVAAGVVKLLDEAKDALKACADAAISFESAITGVYKTVEGSPEQLAKLTEEIRKMALEIPLTVEELAGIAEAGGQLGIATDDITAFTRVIAMLSSSTNLTAESAAETLAKFANITGLSAQEYENLGAAIVALGNNYATTESDILNMAIRIASAGTQVGLTVEEILGFSTALSSLGLEAEAGGTAFSTAIKKMQIAVETGSPKLESFAEVAGMTREEFIMLWSTDTAGAIEAFIKGLGNVDEASDSTIKMLDEVGLTGIRVSDAWSRMSINTELVSDALELSNKAFEENTALVKEASMRYETTESKLTMCQNAAKDLAISVGQVLNPAIENIAEAGKDAFIWANDFVRDNPEIVKAITAVSIALGTFVAGIGGLVAITKAIEVLSVALSGLSPAGAIAIGIGALVAGLTAFMELQEKSDVEKFVDDWKDFSDEIERNKESFENSSAAIEENRAVAEKLIDRLAELAENENRTAKENLEMKGIVEQLNVLMPELALAYDDVTGSITQNGKAVENLRKSLTDIAREKYNQEEINLLTERMVELLREQESMTQRLAKAEEEYAIQQQAAADVLDAKATYLRPLLEMLPAIDAGYLDAVKSSRSLKRTIDELNEKLAENESQQQEVTQRYEELVTASAEAKKATEELAKAQDEASEAGEAYAALLQTVRAEYEETYESARNSIETQIGLWDKFTAEVKEDVDSLLEIWEKQSERLIEYSDNLTRAVELGVDKGLVEKWADGSATSAAYIGQLIEKIDELIAEEGDIGPKTQAYINEFNEAYRMTQQAKDHFAQTIAELQTGYNQLKSQAEQASKDITDGIKNVVANVPEEMYKQGERAMQRYVDGINSQMGAVMSAMAGLQSIMMMGMGAMLTTPVLYDQDVSATPIKDQIKAAQRAGADTAQGYAYGIQSNLDTVQGAARELASTPINTVKSVQDMHSPSKVMAQLGGYTVDGYVMGMRDKLREVEDAAKNMAGITAEIVGGDTIERLAAMSVAPQYARHDNTTELIAAIRSLSQPSTHTTNAPVLHFYNNNNLSPYEIARNVRRELEAMARHARA